MMDQVIEKPSGAVTILLVEDDDGDAKAVTRAFSKAEIANPVVRAVDGEAALEFLRADAQSAWPRQFLLLVDINMPRMNGHELVAELRKDRLLRRLVVIMLSTSRDKSDVNAAYDNNVAGFVVKGRAGRDYQSLVATLNDYWTLIELPEAS